MFISLRATARIPSGSVLISVSPAPNRFGPVTWDSPSYMKIIRVEARDLYIFLTCTSCGLYFFSPRIFQSKSINP
jgi:hypothetical protein